MPNQRPQYLRMYKKKRPTRRQAETLIKALLTVDDEQLFEKQEKRSFGIGFDKLTNAWRDALAKEQTPKGE